jgi:hypothetical protein
MKTPLPSQLATPPATLADILRGIERGVFPAPDLTVSEVPAPSERDACVIGLTGHIVVAAAVWPGTPEPWPTGRSGPR